MEYNYHNPLSVTSQFSFCGLPFRLDTYAGCAIGCRYCFARLRGGNINTRKILVANPDVIIKKFETALISDNSGIISQFIRRGMPVHFGGMSDPFQSLEKHFQVSYKVLEYLKSINYPVVISTKSDLLAENNYLNLIKGYKNLVVQFSFSSLNEDISKVMEPNSCNPLRLLDVIKELSTNNVNVSIRWQPYIVGVSDEIPFFFDSIKHLNIKHLGFEHLKLPTEKNHELEEKINSIAGLDIYKFYKDNRAKVDGREYVLPIDYKLNNLIKIKSEALRIGIDIGYADNEFQYLSNADCCCSGVDRYPGFENWYKPQISYAIKQAYNNKAEFITLNAIRDEWNSNGAIDKYINSKSRLERKMNHNTMYDYVSSRWNNLDSNFNPVNYYNIDYANEIDNYGNKIFKFAKTSQL